MEGYRKRLAERLEYERKGKGLSREALAARADVTKKTIERIEKAEIGSPRSVTIRRLATALEISPAALQPPPEIEEDRLDRIEGKLDRLLEHSGLPIEPVADADPEALAAATEGLAATRQREGSDAANETAEAGG